MYDVVIVGGGSSGLSAALIFGLSCRNVLLVDDGEPRNWHAHAIHGLLAWDGKSPRDFLKSAREDIKKFSNIKTKFGRVHKITRGPDRFTCEIDGKGKIESRKIVLATGISDEIPPWKNLEKFFGKTAYHCPYCGGYELRGKKISVLVTGEKSSEFAIELKMWSENVTAVSDGFSVPTSEKEKLKREGIELIEKKIMEIEGTDGQISALKFVDDSRHETSGLFFISRKTPKNALADSLNCVPGESGGYEVKKGGRTNIPGLFLIGDLSCSLQFVAIAIAEGVECAVQINDELVNERCFPQHRASS